MEPIPGLTETAIRALAGPDSFSKGRAYNSQGNVLEVVRRGPAIHAEVQGSEPDPYIVELQLDGGAIKTVSCTCPYSYDDACKHIVAVALYCLETPEEVEERQPIPELLTGLGRDHLHELVLRLAALDPANAEAIERWTQAPHFRAARASGAVEYAPLDVSGYRKRIRSAYREASNSYGGYNRYGEYVGYQSFETVAAVVREILEEAEHFMVAGDFKNTLHLLAAVAEECVAEYETVDDEADAAGEVMGELAVVAAEAALLAEFTNEEREDLERRFSALEEPASEWCPDAGFRAIRMAIVDGWEAGSADPGAAAIVEDETREWEEEEPDEEEEDDRFATSLALFLAAKLNALERRGRIEEFLQLSAELCEHLRHAEMLLRLERVPEAAAYGADWLVSAEQAQKLVGALAARGAVEEGMRVAEAVLERLEQAGQRPGPYAGWVWSFPGRVALAEWLRDVALEQGQPERALEPAVIAFRDLLSQEAYQAVERLAGDRWSDLREELLGRVRQAPYPTSSQVRILLYEGLWDEALAAADRQGGHEIVALVADAVSDSHPDWVVTACKRQFDRIADAGNAPYYVEAAAWLKRARDVLVRSGRTQEWQRYLEETLARHQRKYKLAPLLKALR